MKKLIHARLNQLQGRITCHARLSSQGLVDAHSPKKQERIEREQDQWKDLLEKFPMLYSAEGLSVLFQLVKFRTKRSLKMEKVERTCSFSYP